MNNKRKYTKEEKQQIIEEALATKNIAAVARKNNIPSNTVQTWIRKLKPKSSLQANQEDYKKIKQQYEDLLLENKILKDILKKTMQILE